jgi:hypothetical protein
LLYKEIAIAIVIAITIVLAIVIAMVGDWLVFNNTGFGSGLGLG